MTNCTQACLEFPALKRHKIQAQFSGGDVTSDGGVLLLREIDRRLQLTQRLSAAIPDPRNPVFIIHDQAPLLFATHAGFDFYCQAVIPIKHCSLI